MQENPSPNLWSEDASNLFLDLADIFVPARAEQFSSLLQLIPATSDETFTIVELGSGEGKLAEAILTAFPHCHYLALDGSELMRTTTLQRLSRFSSRLELRPFALSRSDWRSELPGEVRCILSSLCVHHLSGSEKRQLFHDMSKCLAPGGALLLADLVLPVNRRVNDFFASQYDEIVRAQSLSTYGDLRGFTAFENESWNFYHNDPTQPDPYDQPSSLYEQLRWLQEVGFHQVDCYWMRAGHAVYGGYR